MHAPSATSVKSSMSFAFKAWLFRMLDRISPSLQWSNKIRIPTLRHTFFGTCYTFDMHAIVDLFNDLW